MLLMSTVSDNITRMINNIFTIKTHQYSTTMLMTLD